jgi:hypothetical protein
MWWTCVLLFGKSFSAAENADTIFDFIPRKIGHSKGFEMPRNGL